MFDKPIAFENVVLNEFFYSLSKSEQLYLYFEFAHNLSLKMLDKNKEVLYKNAKMHIHEVGEAQHREIIKEASEAGRKRLEGETK